MRYYLQATICVALSILVQVAHADTTRDTARLHYSQGSEAFRQMRYDEAIEEWLAAHKLVPDSALLFNLASAYQRLGDIEGATRYCRMYAAVASTGPVACPTGKPQSTRATLGIRPTFVEYRGLDTHRRAVIQATIRRHHPEIRHCYELALRSTRDLKGRVVLRIRVTQAGASASIAELSPGMQPVAECMTRKVASWQFLSSVAGADFTYPFRFRKLRHEHQGVGVHLRRRRSDRAN